jgi:rubredoxin
MNTAVIKTFDNYFNANIILTRLQQEGFECYLYDEFTATIDPILTNAIGGIKLVVKKEDEITALALLASFDDAYKKAATCPQCGMNDFVQTTKPGAGNIFTAIFTWLFSNYAIAPNPIYQCNNCGYETKELPAQTFTDDDV